MRLRKGERPAVDDLGGFAAVGVVFGSAIAAATLIPMMHGMTGEGPHVPPLVFGAFVTAAGGLASLATTVPARAALRDWS